MHTHTYTYIQTKTTGTYRIFITILFVLYTIYTKRLNQPVIRAIENYYEM